MVGTSKRRANEVPEVLMVKEPCGNYDLLAPPGYLWGGQGPELQNVNLFAQIKLSNQMLPQEKRINSDKSNIQIE